MAKVSDIPHCLTNVIDQSYLGDAFYHNIKTPDFDVIVARPRIPVRYDLLDAEAVKLNSKAETEKLLGVANLSGTQTYYHVKRTLRSKINTFLSDTLAIILIAASIVNMNKILRVLRDDATLTEIDRVLFKWVFALSFVVVVFLSCYLVLAWFDFYRSRSRLPTLASNGFKYTDLRGSTSWLNAAVLIFVVVVIVIAFAETINILLVGDTAILLLLLPILACVGLLIYLITLWSGTTTTAPTEKQKQNESAQQKYNKLMGAVRDVAGQYFGK